MRLAAAALLVALAALAVALHAAIEARPDYERAQQWQRDADPDAVIAALQTGEADEELLFHLAIESEKQGALAREVVFAWLLAIAAAVLGGLVARQGEATRRGLGALAILLAGAAAALATAVAPPLL